MLWERKSKSSKMEFFHTSVWQTFGKPRYFFSLVEMCNLVGVEPTVQTHCGMWVWRRTTTGSLCQPGERRGGGGFVPNNHVVLEEGGYYQVSSMSIQWMRKMWQKRGREMRMGESWGNHFAGEHALAQWPLCLQIVIEFSVCRLFVGDGWERTIQMGN